MLSIESTLGCREAAARAIANLAADSIPDQLLACLSSTGAMLTHLARVESSEQAQISAAIALGNLSCGGEETASVIADAGAAAALTILCQSPISAVREAGVFALLEVCNGSPQGRRTALQTDAVPWLVQMLLLGEDGVKKAAVACLGELAREGPGARRKIRESGAVPILRQLAVPKDSRDIGGLSATSTAVVFAAADALQALDPSEMKENEILEERFSSLVCLSLKESSSRLWGSGLMDGELLQESGSQGVSFTDSNTITMPVA